MSVTTTNRIIIHVDLDAFYTSVELSQNPALKGLPVVVGADPEGGKGRGVVVACSYEARRFGLRSGMPISRAYKLCPDAIYLRPDLAKYGQASARIMDLLRLHADRFEQTGVDEAFMDVSSRVRSIDEARKLAQKIKKELREAEGLTCSIGIAPNKSCAKIASDLLKPDGLTIVPPNKVAESLAPLPVTVIPGVGKKTHTFLQERGIETISQLQQVPGKQLIRWFGRNGVWLWGVIHGKEQIEVRPREIPRSLNVEKTFREDVQDYDAVFEAAEGLVRELIRRLRLQNLQYKTAGIKIRFSGFKTHTTERSFTDYSDSLDALRSTVRSLLEKFEASGSPVRLIGVRVSQLRKGGTKSLTLDSWG